jgi:hypothetical protein
MRKPSLILRFQALLEERLRGVEASIADARSGMRVDAGFRPENRGERAAVTTQGYLAAGLGRRAGEIKAALELLDRVDPGPRDQVSPGALVLLDDGERERWTLLLPGGHGDRTLPQVSGDHRGENMRPATPRIRHLAPLTLMALCACKFGWTDTGDEDNPIVQQRSHDFVADSLLLGSNGDVGVMATAEGVVQFDTWTGSASATTPADDFSEPTVWAWVGSQVAIVDRSADAGVFLWEPGELDYDLREDSEGANASAAVGFDGGLAWIGRRAENCRVLRDGMEVVSIEGCGYIRDLDARDDGTLFLGYDDDAGGLSVLRVDLDGGLVHLEVPMAHISWDETRQVLYTASQGATRVEAVTVDGGPVFSVDLPGTVEDLVSLEREGLLAVLAVQGADAYVHFIDQYSGLEVANIDAASSATGLVTSADGSTIAILQPDRMVLATIDWERLLASFADTGA